jgi:uncharacterized protein (DUF427 family)
MPAGDQERERRREEMETDTRQEERKISGARKFAGEDAPGVLLEPTPKRVRVFFDGETVADSTRTRLLYHSAPVPDYYFPRDDVREDLLEATEHTTECPMRGEARYWSVSAGGRKAENAVWNYHDPPGDIPDISDLLAFDWSAMDAWFEEEEEVFVHPRDPYHRIDVRESARHVEIRVGDTLVAESRRPVLLFETGLPVRYYLPKLDVRTDLLDPRELRTACPYKGVTSGYWGAGELGDDDRELAWCYERPLVEVAKIAGRIAFYNERVDLTVDGAPQERPQTAWS